MDIGLSIVIRRYGNRYFKRMGVIWAKMCWEINLVPRIY